jgi:hypothetical protein
MSKPWYEQNPELYTALREEVESVYTELHFNSRAGGILVTGYYPLFEDDRVWDRYQVKLQLSQDSPGGIPALYEIGNRIPRKPERHMEPDGKACIVLPDAYWYEHPQGMNTLDFLNGPARHFFVNQSLIDLGQSNVWQNGEWGHGTEGIVEFYAAILGIGDPRTILAYLGILKRHAIKGHWPCPCGSKRKLRNCHGELINELRTRIPQLVAAESERKLAEKLAKSGSAFTSRYGG